MSWDPKVGFKVPYGPYTVYNTFICETSVSGREFKSMFIPVRQSECIAFLSKSDHWKMKTIALKEMPRSHFVCFVSNLQLLLLKMWKSSQSMS